MKKTKIPSIQTHFHVFAASRETGILILQLLTGAGLWLGFLVWLSPLNWQTLLTGQTIPLFWQNTYLIGLYLWLLICLRLSLRRTGQTWLSGGLKWNRYWTASFGSGVLLFGCFWSWGVLSGQLHASPLLPANTPSLLLLVKALLLAGATAWALAVVEELLFRGWLWDVWLPVLGPQRTAVFQAVLFCVVHGESWQSGWVALHLFLAGLLLGHLRQWTGQIGPGLALHAGWVWAVLSLNHLGGLQTLTGPYHPLREGPTLLIWLIPIVWLWFKQRLGKPKSAKNDAGSASVA